MIRDARFADIPAILMLLQEGYARSHYAKEGRASIDVKEAKRLLFNAIQRHGGQTGGSCWVQVSEANGTVCGLIAGTLARPYMIGTGLMATDLFWLAGTGCPVGDAFRLMRGMIEWATAKPDVIEIRCGTTAAIQARFSWQGILPGRIWQPWSVLTTDTSRPRD